MWPILFLVACANSFSFKELTVYADTTVIGESAEYTFEYQRYVNNNYDQTSWNSEAVSSTAQITLNFPNDFSLTSGDCTSMISSITVSSVAVSGYGCSISGQTLTVTGAFTSVTNLNVYDVFLVVSGITNPVPAKTTGEFSGTIGIDTADPNGAASINLSAAPFDSCSVTFNTAVVNQTSVMIITLDPKHELTSSASIIVQLPSSRRWTNDISTSNTLPLVSSMSCANYSAGVNAVPLCTGDLGSFTLTASSVLTGTTTSSFSFGVSNFKSPPTLQPSDALTITSYQGFNAVDTCTVYVTSLIENSFTSLSIEPVSTYYVNSAVGLKFSMTLPDFVNNYDDLRFTFPSELTIAYSFIVGIGSYESSLTSVSGQTITIYQRRLATRIYNPSSVYYITIYNIKAPPSTQVSSDITVEIIRNGYGKIRGTTTVQAVAKTLTGTVTVTATTVWASTSYVFSIAMTDGLSSSGQLKIYFPATITPTAVVSCATLSGTGVVTNPTCSYVSGTKMITVSAMNSSSTAISSQTLTVTVLSVQNAPSIAPSNSFSIQSYYTAASDTLVASGTIPGVTATIGTIDSATVTVTPSTYVAAATLVTYTIQFTNTYEIPNGGAIQLGVPLAITMNIGSVSGFCKISKNGGSFISTTCSGSTPSDYLVRFSAVASGAAIAAGSTIALKIEQVFTNPPDTGVVSSFSIKSYHSNSYAIEQITSGISVQMTDPAQFVTTAVSRNSNTNSDTAVEYTIKLKQKSSMAAGSYLFITFPTDIELTDAVSCGALTCSKSTTTSLQVTLGTVTANTEFSVVVSGVINPPSFAPITEPFSFLTQSSNGLIDYASGTRTLSSTNTVASAFQQDDFSFSSQIYGEATTVELLIIPSDRIIPSYLIITLASSFAVPSSISCTSWTCEVLASHQIKATGATSAEMSITINGFTAPTASTAIYTKISSFTAAGYKIDESKTKVLWTALCILPCRTCTANISACQTCFSNTAIASEIYLYDSGDMCYEDCPSGTYTNTGLAKCLDCDNICQECELTASNCTKCNLTSSYPYLNIEASEGDCVSECPSDMYPDATTQPIECVLCVSPCATCTAVDVCESCVDGFYFHNGECINPCPASITITNDVTNECDACNVICSGCSGTVDNCTGCSSASVIYINPDGSQTCLSVCPAPQVNNTGTCSDCSEECKTCSLTYDNCTSCNESSPNSLFYLYEASCLPDCPSTYYEHLADGECKNCSDLNLNCDNCTSTSTCGSCNDGFVFYLNRCLDEAPAGFYDNAGYAEACDTSRDCATCDVLAFNCTSCINYYLEGNDCEPVCSPGLVGINGVCQLCTPPCKSCSESQTNCTSCIPNSTNEVFLSNFDCVNNCPNYTYEDFSNNECTDCVSPCEKCDSASACTSCLLGFFLLNQTCINPCQFGYLGINRICYECTSPCESCESTLTNCLTCIEGHYYVSSTKRCLQDCATIGLYPNIVDQICSGCTSPCDTCDINANNCTSCLTGFLYENDCVVTCTDIDGYYGLNKKCVACTQGCSRCTSASVCTACELNYKFYNSQCLLECPPSHPVIINDVCSECTDANCITCDENNQCSECDYPTILFNGDCITECPTNYSPNVTNNGTFCYYDPPAANTTETVTEEVLNETLTNSDIFPVPFTIGAAFTGIACLMSKFQHPNTFIAGSLYSIWSLLEWASLGVASFFYLKAYLTQITFTREYVEAFIFGGAVAFLYLLNIIAIFVQNCFLKRNDEMFSRWLEKQSPNSCCYCFSSAVGLLCTHKFKNIMFCKLFGFDVFKAKLDSVQNFKIFNIFSFLSFVSSAGVLFGTSVVIYENKVVNQALMAYIDVLVLTLLCIILAILTSRKENDFFEEKDEDGIIMHKRIADSDSVLQEAIVPMMAEQEEFGGNMKNVMSTDRKLRSMETISDYSSEPKTEEKVMMNISIQAAPILQDYSKIDFYNDDGISDFSMFHKADQSVNVTHELPHNDVSIQHEPNIFDQKEVSIQNNPFHEDASIQNIIDVRDISLQNVVNQDDQGMQMSRHEEQHSVQVGVLMNNASVQYSTKPVFENFSREMYDSEGEEAYSDANDQIMQEIKSQSSQRPAQRDGGLKKELELDVDEKIRRKQEEEEERIAYEREKEKQQMIKNFHREQERKMESELERETPLKKVDEFDRINQLYNNNSSNADSSMMSSNADVIVNFQSRKGQEKKEKEDPQRIQSAKTEKEIIEMLSKKEEEGGLNQDSSLSFNVTRDLDAENMKRNNVVVYEEDKVMNSDDEQQLEDSRQDEKRREVFILPQQDSQEQLPSNLQKSRSTNFLSTVRGGRRPPLQQHPSKQQMKEGDMIDSSEIYDMDMSGPLEEDEEINERPMGEGKKKYKPTSNYREEDINYEPRSNLANLPSGRRNRNTISAQHLGERRKAVDLTSEELSPDKRELRHNPLPPPKVEKMPSHEYSGEDSVDMYRKPKPIFERKLQFDEDERLDFDDEVKKDLPRVLRAENKLQKVSSHGKISDSNRDGFDKPIHREILGRDQSLYSRTDKYLEKQQKRVEETRRKINQMNVMLERPDANSSDRKRSYLNPTYSSEEKNKKHALEKVYMNNPFDKKK